MGPRCGRLARGTIAAQAALPASSRLASDEGRCETKITAGRRRGARRGRALRGRLAAGRGRRARPEPPTPRARFKTLTRLYPGRPGAGAGGRPRRARGLRRREAARRSRRWSPSEAAKARGDLAGLGAARSPRTRRRPPRRSSPARSSAPTASTASSGSGGRGDAGRARVADRCSDRRELAAAVETARVYSEAAEPRPRPAGDAGQLRHARGPRRARRGDRRRLDEGHGRGPRRRRDPRQGHGRPRRRQPGRPGRPAPDRPPLLRRRQRPDARLRSARE